jgi:hypothetical protein
MPIKIYEDNNFTGRLFGRKTWYFTLKEKPILRVSESLEKYLDLGERMEHQNGKIA